MKLYNDDCMNAFKNIQSESVDCIVTDCPYHICSGGQALDSSKSVCGGILKKINGEKYIGDSKHAILSGILDETLQSNYVKGGKLFQYNEIKFSEWLPECYRVLKPNTHIYIYINARNLKKLQQEAENAGFVFQNLLVWNKGNATPNKFYLNGTEFILMLRKGGQRYINNMGTSNLLTIPNIIGNKLHPTEKPVALNKILIENSTTNNQIVLDPFMGSGSCGVAAKELGREFIGFEIDEKYFEIAKKRIDGVYVHRSDEDERQLTMFDLVK